MSYFCGPAQSWCTRPCTQNCGGSINPAGQEKYSMQTGGLAQRSPFQILNSFVHMVLFLKLASLSSTSIGTKLQEACLHLSFCPMSCERMEGNVICEESSEVSRTHKRGCWLNENKILMQLLWFLVYPLRGQLLHWGSHSYRWGTTVKGIPQTTWLPSCLHVREGGTLNQR